MRRCSLCNGTVRGCGFTLIELLVVIGVISLLIAILLPGLAKARTRVRRTVCSTHLREIAVGLQVYTDTNQDWYPTAESPEGTSGPENWWENGALLSTIGLEPNPDERSVLTCPADPEPDRCLDGSLKVCRASYGANTSAFGMRRGRSKQGRRRHQVKAPAEALAFADAAGKAQAPLAVGWQGCVSDNFSFRHDKLCSVLYLDTHVGWISSDDLQPVERAWEDPFWGNDPCFDRP